VNGFGYERGSADILYIAPGGAWTTLARDGDTSDADAQDDGITTVDVSRLRPAGGFKAAPSVFVPGGTLFVIDSSRLDLLEVKIDASILAGAQ
jgi:hypothetical protein